MVVGQAQVLAVTVGEAALQELTEPVVAVVVPARLDVKQLDLVARVEGAPAPRRRLLLERDLGAQLAEEYALAELLALEARRLLSFLVGF